MTVKFHKAKIKYWHLKWSCVLIVWELLGTHKIFSQRNDSLHGGWCMKGCYIRNNPKNTTEPNRPGPQHFWSKCSQGESHHSLPMEAASKQDGEPVPKTCQTLGPREQCRSRQEKKGPAWGFQGQGDAGMEIEAMNDKGAVWLGSSDKHSSGMGKGWSKSESFSLHF